MRNGVLRALAGGAVALAGAGLLGGCGSGDSNAKQVCGDATTAFQQYMTQIRGVSAAKPAQWRQPTEQLAGRVDALAAEAEDDALKEALKAEAGRLRTAAASIGTGDAAQLNTAMAETPKSIGRVCK